MPKRSILWNIWSPDLRSNLGRQQAFAHLDPTVVVDLWVAGRQRLNTRPLGLNPADYVALPYPVNHLDSYGN